ncbi:hypothetical protein FOA52_000805 [Chlamydomonas sp. UWO 241]|nr:hypothetical protein FOA52_000805 [Chlamydomonas sp. UWO 241]
MGAAGMQSGMSTFQVVHGTAKKTVKGEDVLSVVELVPGSPNLGILFLVCDGHLGVRAAAFVAHRLPKVLRDGMPPLPKDGSHASLLAFIDGVQQGVSEAFVVLENEWMRNGRRDGTTVTAAVLHPQQSLLTVANVGDSSAVLDTGCSILGLTCDHRIEHSQLENQRLTAAGCHLAQLSMDLQGPTRGKNEVGVGPVRLWPGGLCVSRSIGDADCGPEILPLPHVRQVLIPPRGCRIILASDGMWDCMSLSRAAKIARSRSPSAAAAELVRVAAANLYGIVDDTSAIVVDMMPAERFASASGGDPSGSGAGGLPAPAAVLARAPPPLPWEPRTGGGLSALFACLRGSIEEPDSRDAELGSPARLIFFADIDALHSYPYLLEMLDNEAQEHDARWSYSLPPAVLESNFTLHGATAGQTRSADPSGSRGGNNHYHRGGGVISADLMGTRTSSKGPSGRSTPARMQSALNAAGATLVGSVSRQRSITREAGRHTIGDNVAYSAPSGHRVP